MHRTTQITTNVEECGPCSIFASFTLAFALQLRKKHGKTSVRVRKTSVRLRKTSVRVQYSYYQNTHTHTHTHYKTHTHTYTHTLQNPHTHTYTHTHTHITKQVQNSSLWLFQAFVFNAKLKLHQIIVMISNTKLANLVQLIASNYSFLLETRCVHFAFYYIEFHAAVALCRIKPVAWNQFLSVCVSPVALGRGRQCVDKIVKVCFAGVSRWPAADQYGGGSSSSSSSTLPGASQLLLSELCSEVRRVAALWSWCLWLGQAASRCALFIVLQCTWLGFCCLCSCYCQLKGCQLQFPQMLARPATREHWKGGRRWRISGPAATDVNSWFWFFRTFS